MKQGNHLRAMNRQHLSKLKDASSRNFLRNPKVQIWQGQSDLIPTKEECQGNQPLPFIPGLEEILSSCPVGSLPVAL